MTADASLPPADVQRPTPPLTDEELAERDLNNLLEQLRAHGMFEARAIAVSLIAALRASRAEVERLREAVSDVAAAIRVEGHSPAYHHKVMREHRRQWPTLWRALDRLVGRRV